MTEPPKLPELPELPVPSGEGAARLARVRADFPALAQEVNGRPLVYLDSAATAQKPVAVLRALERAYTVACGNVHRAVHTLGQRATDGYEGARETVRRFLGAASASEIVFTRGTTEAINLVAQTLGPLRVGEGDEVLITSLEHHANLVPWQLLCQRQRARLRVLPLDERGQLPPGRLGEFLTPRTRLFALSHASNALGTLLPVAELCAAAHACGALVLVDGAQAVPHRPVDVRALGCDFYCFSGHKLYGPTGIGVLWGRAELLAELPPWQVGGDMVTAVTLEHTEFAPPPQRFEAGTPPIAEAMGLAAAMDYVEALGWDAIAEHEAGLLAHAAAVLPAVEGLVLHGPALAAPRLPILTFSLHSGGRRVHPHDVATLLDGEGIAVRAGHHCAQPVHAFIGVPATVRASLGLYSTASEIDALAAALRRVVGLFR
ncbi:MAG: SufS family cysteine desulfurase [Polyangia bacterium]